MSEKTVYNEVLDADHSALRLKSKSELECILAGLGQFLDTEHENEAKQLAVIVRELIAKVDDYGF
jgi:hypothetical protein